MKVSFILLGFYFILPLDLKAQRAVYITPHTGFHTGSYSGPDALYNNKYFIETRKFMHKIVVFGIQATYVTGKAEISLGAEQGGYSTGLYYKSDKNFPSVSNRNFESDHHLVIFSEIKYNAYTFNKEVPRWLKNTLKIAPGNNKEKYLFVSRIAPFAGIAYHRLPSTFINDIPSYGSLYTTTNGSLPLRYIPYKSTTHVYYSDQFAFRVGADWIFYNNDKRKLVITFLYSLGVNVPVVHNYVFYPDNEPEFKLQTSTRGNGFTIKAGFPIKIWKQKNK